MADFRRLEVDSEAWYELDTRAELEPRIKAFVDRYRPDLNGGQTLSTWLQDRGIGTSFDYYDTFQSHSNGAHTWRFGSISGNNYSVGIHTDPQGSSTPYSSVKSLDVAQNAGGRATRCDADAIQNLAFGLNFKEYTRCSWKDLVLDQG